MTRLRFTQSIAIGILIFAGTVGCAPAQLTSSEAAKQLRPALEASSRQDVTLRYSALNGNVAQSCGDRPCPPKVRETHMEKGLAALERHGLIVTNFVGTAVFQGLYKVTLTGEGQKYLNLDASNSSQLLLRGRVRSIDNLDIVGVGAPSDRRGKKVSVVKYRVSYKPTPVGVALGEQPTSQVREAFFALYDKGWKLEAPKR